MAVLSGILTVTLDADSPASDGTQLISTGTITFSGVYDQAAGDTFDPASMGLSTLAFLDLEMATNGQGVYTQPALVEALPKVSKLFFPTQPLLHIKATGITDPLAANISTADDAGPVPITSGSPIDMSAFTGRFRAWGT